MSTSILFVRRRFFEVFLKMHTGLSICLLACLWIHIKPGKNFPTVMLAVASALRAIQLFSWICRLSYRNIGGARELSEITHLQDGGASVEASRLQVRVRRPWQVRHGQYVYVTIPSLPHSLWSGLQSHPYLIAWSEHGSKGVYESNAHNNSLHKSLTLTLLIESRYGFSDKLRHIQEGLEFRVVLDGPYGFSPPLKSFDKVLFLATGIGIAAHLLAIRGLIRDHNNQSARVRRISLLWLIDKPSKYHPSQSGPVRLINYRTRVLG